MLNFVFFMFRYDKEGTGALHSNHFFKLCGLDPKGRPRQAAPYTPRGAAYPLPRPHSEIAHTNGFDKPQNLKKLLKDAKNSDNVDNGENRVKQTINVPVATSDERDLNMDSNAMEEDKKSKEEANKIEKIKKHKAPPKLDNIIDCLHYKVCFFLFSFIINFSKDCDLLLCGCLVERKPVM